MPDYSHVNLLELPDSADERFPGIEGRFGRAQIGSRDLGVSHWRYAPGVRANVAHRHRVQEEAFVVVSGSGRALLDDDLVPLRAWDVLRVAPAVVRAFEAGPEGLELLAVGGPKPEGGDGVPSTANWPGPAHTPTA